jgi:hypothetical protein
MMKAGGGRVNHGIDGKSRKQLGLAAEDGWMMVDGGRELGRQKTDDRRQKTEDRRQKTEGRRRKAEDR